jgi:hypothetical protein
LVGAGDGSVLYTATLLKASSMQSSSTHSCYFCGNPKSGYSRSDDGGVRYHTPSRASFLEQLLDGGGKRWSGVSLPRRRSRVSAVWHSGVSVTDMYLLDSRRAAGPSGAIVASMASLVTGSTSV